MLTAVHTFKFIKGHLFFLIINDGYTKSTLTREQVVIRQGTFLFVLHPFTSGRLC